MGQISLVPLNGVLLGKYLKFYFFVASLIRQYKLSYNSDMRDQ